MPACFVLFFFLSLSLFFSRAPFSWCWKIHFKYKIANLDLHYLYAIGATMYDTFHYGTKKPYVQSAPMVWLHYTILSAEIKLHFVFCSRLPSKTIVYYYIWGHCIAYKYFVVYKRSGHHHPNQHKRARPKKPIQRQL